MKFRSKLLMCILLVSIIFTALPMNIGSIAPNNAPVKITGNQIDPGERNWNLFWQLFKTHTAWDLEWFDGAAWQTKKNYLTVQREYPEPNDCKLTLIFDAPEQGDYRLTFALDKLVKNYAERESQYQWLLEYDRFKVVFDWSDIMGIPGIQASKGVKDGYFWFRIRRDNVPQGYHMEIDPHFVVAAERWTTHSVRISDSTYFCLVEMQAPVLGQHDLWRSLDSGVTWENLGCITESYGSNESLSQAMFVPDTVDISILHITWGSYAGSHFLQYTRFDNDTGLFTQNIQVINQRGFLHWMEIDSNNVLHFLWEDLTTSSGVTAYLRYRNSTDGGLTWNSITLLDSNSWNDWYINHQLLVTKNNVLNVKWREDDPGAKNHRYMYLRRFTNGTWSTAVDVAGSWDSTYPAGGSDWSSGPNDRLIYTLHNGSSGFTPMTGADIYVTYTNQPTNYSGSLGWIEPISINSGKVWIQDPCIQIDDQGAAHLLAQEWIDGWSAGEFPNPSVGNLSLHYMKEPGYPWNSWDAPEKLNSWHSQVSFSWTRGSAYPIHNRVVGSETFDFLFMVWQGEDAEYDIYYQLLSLILSLEGSITNMEGCGAWLFAEERYYNFVGNVTILNAYLDTMQMRFTDAGAHVLQWYFRNSTTDYIGIAPGSSDYMRMKDLVSGDVQSAGSWVSVEFNIYLTGNVIDTANVDLWMNANTTVGDEMGWIAVQTDYFHLESIGGLSLSTNTTGNAGRITGGDVFDFYAENGSSVQSEIIFRNLQHIKMAPSFYFGPLSTETNPAFHITYRFDYCGADDEGWITGFGVTLFPVVAVTGYGGGDERHIIYNVTLYNRGGIVESLNISTYFRYEGIDPGGIGESRMFFDLWFNKVNASSTAGVRVNAYEYPMKNIAAPWISWLVGATWTPNEALRKDMMLFAPLLDASNQTFFVPEIKLVRVFVNLTQTDLGSYFRTEMRDYDIWDLTFDRAPPFDGIQTPQMDDTKVPYIYGGGLLGSLWTAISGLWFDIIGPAVLGFWEIFVGFLDTIAGAMGFPNFFSNLFTYLGQLWEGFVAGILAFGSILGSGLAFLTSWLSMMLSIINDALVQWLSMFEMGVDMIGGAYGVGVDLIETFNIPVWISLALIFYPLYLFIMWDEYGLERVISHLKSVAWIPTLVFQILSWIIMGFISILTAIIESIPIAE